MSRWLISASLALILYSCNKQQNGSEQAFYSQDHSKPVVAIIPMIDNTGSDLPWSLSDELTTTIHYRLSQKENFFLIEDQKIRTVIKKLSESQNPFSSELGWIKKSFQEQDFVVFLELVEHEEVPLYPQKASSLSESAASLNMSVRVRVFDLRSEQPHIVLQELVHDEHHIAKPFNRYNFHQVSWGDESFSISPLGLAHAQLSKEIASRIESYILSAKNL